MSCFDIPSNFVVVAVRSNIIKLPWFIWAYSGTNCSNESTQDWKQSYTSITTAFILVPLLWANVLQVRGLLSLRRAELSFSKFLLSSSACDDPRTSCSTQVLEIRAILQQDELPFLRAPRSSFNWVKRPDLLYQTLNWFDLGACIDPVTPQIRG